MQKRFSHDTVYLSIPSTVETVEESSSSDEEDDEDDENDLIGHKGKAPNELLMEVQYYYWLFEINDIVSSFVKISNVTITNTQLFFVENKNNSVFRYIVLIFLTSYDVVRLRCFE